MPADIMGHASSHSAQFLDLRKVATSASRTYSESRNWLVVSKMYKKIIVHDIQRTIKIVRVSEWSSFRSSTY